MESEWLQGGSQGACKGLHAACKACANCGVRESLINFEREKASWRSNSPMLIIGPKLIMVLGVRKVPQSEAKPGRAQQAMGRQTAVRVRVGMEVPDCCTGIVRVRDAKSIRKWAEMVNNAIESG